MGGSYPIWRSKDGKHEKCIGSIEELKEEIDLSISFNIMKINPLNEFIVGDFSEKNYNIFDLHKPYVDDIVVCTDNGKTRLFRELDLIDVWFDQEQCPMLNFIIHLKTTIILKKIFRQILLLKASIKLGVVFHPTCYCDNNF